jgi:DNA-directed RNA polymerase subunit omega
MPNEPILPQPDVLNQAEYGKFVLTNLAAKRAKQIKEGAPPLVRIESSHPLSIALAEIAAGKIRPLMGEEAEAAMADQLETLEELSTERFLLPGLDDDELSVGIEEEEDTEEEGDETAASLLTELLGEDDADEEVEVDLDDSPEISLDDLAKQEDEESEHEAEAE